MCICVLLFRRGLGAAANNKEKTDKIDRTDKTKTTKTKVLEIIMTMHPGYPWISHVAKTGKFKNKQVYDKVNEDMADAYIMAKAGPLIPL